MFKVPLKHYFAFIVAILLHGWVALLFVVSFEFEKPAASGDLKVPINLVSSDLAALMAKPPIKAPENKIVDAQPNEDRAAAENAAKIKAEQDKVAAEAEKEKQAKDAAEAKKQRELVIAAEEQKNASKPQKRQPKQV